MNILYPTRVRVRVHVCAGPPGFCVWVCTRVFETAYGNSCTKCVCAAETLSINWAGVGGLQNDRVLSTIPACSTALRSRLSRIGAWGAVRLHCYPCACVCACLYVCVCLRKGGNMQNPRWVAVLRTYMYSRRDKCALLTHTLVPDIFISAPSSCSLVLSIPKTGHGEQKKRRAGWREERLFASKEHWKEADVASTVLSCHPPLLPNNHRVLCTWAAPVPLIWGHLFFWCGPCTTQSTVRHWGVHRRAVQQPWLSLFNSSFSNFMSRDTNIAEPVCCQPEEQHSRLQPGRRSDDGG